MHISQYIYIYVSIKVVVSPTKIDKFKFQNFTLKLLCKYCCAFFYFGEIERLFFFTKFHTKNWVKKKISNLKIGKIRSPTFCCCCCSIRFEEYLILGFHSTSLPSIHHHPILNTIKDFGKL